MSTGLTYESYLAFEDSEPGVRRVPVRLGLYMFDEVVVRILKEFPPWSSTLRAVVFINALLARGSIKNTFK